MNKSTNYGLTGELFTAHFTVGDTGFYGELVQIGRGNYKRTLSFHSDQDIQEAINLLQSMRQALEDHHQ